MVEILNLIKDLRDKTGAGFLDCKNALLINPNNSEAVYMLANVNIRKSDYDKAKELIQKYILVCKNDCSKKTELKEKFDKIVPKNEKN